ncbi:hypothetical protein ETAR_07790 [Edwardsiella tarda]|nr:hypothetical protein GBS0709_07710 [Edwardsiella tarda]
MHQYAINIANHAFYCHRFELLVDNAETYYNTCHGSRIRFALAACVAAAEAAMGKGTPYARVAVRQGVGSAWRR